MSAVLYHANVEDVSKSLSSASVDLVIADPPYDIAVQGMRWDKKEDYMSFVRGWLPDIVRVLRPGGALFIYGSPCRIWVARMTILLVDELGMNHVQDMPWVYTQGGDARIATMKSYAVRHERLVWFEKPASKSSRTFNPAAITEHYSDTDRAVALAKGKGRVTSDSLNHGRPPRTFIDIPRENSRSKERNYGNHPSMKPLALCERIIKAHSNVHDVVFIPFAGSGSEMLVSTSLGRFVIGCENQDEYIEIIKRRFVGHDLKLKCSTRVSQH